MITNNIYKRFAKHTDSRSSLRFSRAVILITLLIAAVFTTGNLKSAILTWGFLSMGLRAVVLLGPMCAALFFPSQADRRFVTASSIVGIVILLGSQVPGSARRLPVLGHGRQHPDHRPWLPRAYLSIQIH